MPVLTRRRSRALRVASAVLLASAGVGAATASAPAAAASSDAVIFGAPGGGGGGTTATRIHDIQGAAHISPLNGKKVTDVPGVVTAVGPAGFWMQDPTPDADPATSEGIYVYTSSRPRVKVGDSVTVTATVSEYRPGGSGTGNLTTTELGSPRITVAGSATLPAATLVGSGGRVPPSSVIEDDAKGDVETSGTFDPNTDGIDFWESMEGMRVQITDAAVVGPTNSYGELAVVPAGSGVRTNRGGIVISSSDFNPERVVVDDALAPTPTVDVGDTLAGDTIGVLDYSFGTFMLLPSTTPSVRRGGLAKESTSPATSGQLAVATFNVENLDPTDPQSKFDDLAAAIVTNLGSPDLVALEEVQDNDGATDSSVVDADQTLSQLVSAISAQGGPAYSWRQINPVDDADGGEPGGNIRNVFLYRTDRGLAFVDRPGGTSTAATTVNNVGGVPQLSYSPGRIDPANSAWSSSRKPLAGEFTFNGRTIFVIANHFNSKGGDDPLLGRYQPPTRSSETQRHQQATVVHDFVNDILAVDANADVIVLGDLNDYDFSQTASILTGGGSLVDLPATLPLAERYTYVYEGNSQVLDHILLSGALSQTAYGYDVVHINSEFSTQVSDHDPQVVRIPLP